jgi:di/tricarboxylate transporter
MTTAIIVIFLAFLAWLIIYRIFEKKFEAAADKIKSPKRRNAMKLFLKITYVFSVLVVVVIWVFKVINMFKSNNTGS